MKKIDFRRQIEHKPLYEIEGTYYNINDIQNPKINKYYYIEDQNNDKNGLYVYKENDFKFIDVLNGTKIYDKKTNIIYTIHSNKLVYPSSLVYGNNFFSIDGLLEYINTNINKIDNHTIIIDFSGIIILSDSSIDFDFSQKNVVIKNLVIDEFNPTPNGQSAKNFNFLNVNSITFKDCIFNLNPDFSIEINSQECYFENNNISFNFNNKENSPCDGIINIDSNTLFAYNTKFNIDTPLNIETISNENLRKLINLFISENAYIEKSNFNINLNVLGDKSDIIGFYLFNLNSDNKFTIKDSIFYIQTNVGYIILFNKMYNEPKLLLENNEFVFELNDGEFYFFDGSNPDTITRERDVIKNCNFNVKNISTQYDNLGEIKGFNYNDIFDNPNNFSSLKFYHILYDSCVFNVKSRKLSKYPKKYIIYENCKKVDNSDIIKTKEFLFDFNNINDFTLKNYNIDTNSLLSKYDPNLPDLDGILNLKLQNQSIKKYGFLLYTNNLSFIIKHLLTEIELNFISSQHSYTMAIGFHTKSVLDAVNNFPNNPEQLLSNNLNNGTYCFYQISSNSSLISTANLKIRTPNGNRNDSISFGTGKVYDFNLWSQLKFLFFNNFRNAVISNSENYFSYGQYNLDDIIINTDLVFFFFIASNNVQNNPPDGLFKIDFIKIKQQM